jgi:ABC-type amino acid transport substrate-binding protein
LAVVLVQALQARAETPQMPSARELVIGTKVAPPFAMKSEDGTWHGIGIDLWRRIAEQRHLRYRFQETTLNDLTWISHSSRRSGLLCNSANPISYLWRMRGNEPEGRKTDCFLPVSDQSPVAR